MRFSTMPHNCAKHTCATERFAALGGFGFPSEGADKMTSQVIVNRHLLPFQLVTGPLEPGIHFRIRNFKRWNHTI